MLPEEADTDETVSASWPIFLRGRAAFGTDGRLPRVVKIPAGVRE
jgi:hypothetical protein